ncbi:MAG: 2-C-methyl-D-erythritol 4-phosphate cytidylyltransferase [Lachnospiraceae bacterium]|nr:2-C-methyl-D-erythritol 4-phosphate cytidylyltransferase [Lachnospiraceae bacterium]
MRVCAVVAAGGKGRRMGMTEPKQYMNLCGKQVISYSLMALQKSFVDEIVLVCGEGEEEWVRENIVEAQGFSKVKTIIEGGEERYESVYKGLSASSDADYCIIHDGARPFLTQYILERCLHYAQKYGGAAAASKSHDTVKLAMENDSFIEKTLDRDRIWMIQTPQVFGYDMIFEAYGKLMRDRERLRAADVKITDDTMVAKIYAGLDSRLVLNPYPNIKITTPSDLSIAEALIKSGMTYGQ